MTDSEQPEQPENPLAEKLREGLTNWGIDPEGMTMAQMVDAAVMSGQVEVPSLLPRAEEPKKFPWEEPLPNQSSEPESS